jgi:hypothetical protein
VYLSILFFPIQNTFLVLLKPFGYFVELLGWGIGPSQNLSLRMRTQKRIALTHAPTGIRAKRLSDLDRTATVTVWSFFEVRVNKSVSHSGEVVFGSVHLGSEGFVLVQGLFITWA